MDDAAKALAPAVVSGELVKRPAPETAVDRLRRRLDKIAKDDTDVVQGMNRFSEIPTSMEKEQRAQMVALLAAGTEEQLLAAGWRSRRALRLAIYGTMPKKDWPGAMQAAHERVQARIRKQAANNGPRVLNLNMISIPAPRPPGPEDRVVIVKKGPGE